MFFGVCQTCNALSFATVGTPETVAATKKQMRLTFFHWGLHAWAIYTDGASVLAFFQLPSRSAFNSALASCSHYWRSHIRTYTGHAVDIFAVIGTVFGVATSLGYGVLQVNAGF
ncbi:Glycine betaine transporter BetP [Escherichia coli]|nr:Glycine betaine transporter BetP [Escherichia coli]